VNGLSLVKAWIVLPRFFLQSDRWLAMACCRQPFRSGAARQERQASRQALTSAMQVKV
jgi:hypothetical protein